MLSEFHVPRPEGAFNQILLEPNEVFIESAFVTLHLTSKYSFPGKLNLCTWSVIFQPLNLEMPLLKFKIYDKLQIKCGKFTEELLSKELGAKYDNFVSNILWILGADKFSNSKQITNPHLPTT